MNLKALEHLLALADTGSFSRAAEQCCLTQSALSRSIQNLEQALGGQLLDRIGKRNELTPLGCEVVARARRILLEASELRRSAERLQGGGGSIRVGLGSGPGALLTTPLLCHAAEQHPDLRVSITRGPTELQLLQLRARQLDALVVDARRVAPAPDLQIDPLGDQQASSAAPTIRSPASPASVLSSCCAIRSPRPRCPTRWPGCWSSSTAPPPIRS